MNKHAIKSGIIIGVITIVITLLMYLVDPTVMASMVAGLGILAISLGLVAYFGIQYRNEEGGFMPFGKSWIYSMQAFVIAGLIGTIFRILLFNVIDPELSTIVADAMIENQESMMSSFGMPEDQMEEALDKARESTLDGFTPMGSIIGFLWFLIGYAIFSLITGAIIKKNEPEVEI